MIGAGVPASPVLEEEEGVGGSLIDGGSLLMEEGKSPVPVAADYLTQKVRFWGINESSEEPGPAVVFNRYEGIWVYMVGPICGTVMGAWAYNFIRYTDKPLHEIIQSTSFKKMEEEGFDGNIRYGEGLHIEEGTEPPVSVAIDLNMNSRRGRGWSFSLSVCFIQKVPAYLSAQVLGSMLASGTLRLLFNLKHEHYFGTTATGSNMQSLVLEFIISFYLMFVISCVATEDRAIGELAGFAVGATILLNILSTGYFHEFSTN
ncbi:hypothetical protein MRB53_020000 [Persea americana]|uniref:Uncharacterized protein n=1 Tax=Persea americana TaxID=3435 RepID=A0ACC2L0C1_PERAE|nr:hypothetical protein MRB53_020000 [Persea americana]